MAEHPLIGRRVAVKILHPHSAQNVEAVGRFVSEMRGAQALRHPQIAQVHELSLLETSAGDLPCIVMELLEGRTLGELISDEAPLPPVRALVIAEQIADILVATHERDLVHRNLKSENVFILGGLRGLDRIKLLDFGIGRLGTVNGTPAYLAPEQCLGLDGDEAVDTYALGVLLFEMLTGRLPYRSRGVGDMVLAHIATDAPRPGQLVPTIPPIIDAIVGRALQKDPARRFASMQDMLDALRDPSSYVEPVAPAPIPAPVPVPVPAPAPATATPARRRASRAAVPLAAVFATAATLLALVSVFAAGRPLRPPPSLSPGQVALTVASCAPGARVFLDGVEVGAAGGSFGVPSGQPIDLVVRAPGFQPYERRFVPAADERIEAVLLPAIKLIADS